MPNIILDVNNNTSVWNNFLNNNYCLTMGLSNMWKIYFELFKKIIKINIVTKGYIIINTL